MASKTRSLLLATVCASVMTFPFVRESKAEMKPTLSFSGVPGLIDMPSGDTMPDGTFNLSVSKFGAVSRATLSFQITPWMAASFRLQATGKWNDVLPDPNDYSTYNDRSFDLRFRLAEEGAWMPAVTLGLQDFLGTGFNSAEYLVATKTFNDRLKVTAGIGWGRYGSYQSFGNPFGGVRDTWDSSTGLGSELNADNWFRGPAALFGGLEYKINDKWTVKAEYSSDNYNLESGDRKVFERKNPYNIGVEYAWGDNVRIGAYSLYGSEFGFSFHLVMDPKKPPRHHRRSGFRADPGDHPPVTCLEPGCI